MDSNIKIQKGISGRIEYLDGIRGISSVLVILCHLSCVFIPSFYFAERADTAFSKIWINTPLNVLTNGNIAVQCFFVLSGYLITRKCYVSQDTLHVSPLYEYKKLLKVVIPGVLLSAVLMVSGLMYHVKAFQNNPTLSFVNDYCNFIPTFKSVLSDSFYRSFFEGSVYNGPLWTIRFEFWGALFTSAISFYCFNNKKHAKVIYLLLGLIFFIICPNLVGFMVGAFSFDSLFQDNNDKSILGRIMGLIMTKKLLIIPFFITGLYFACINNAISGLWAPMTYVPLLGDNAGAIRAIGIAICLICIDKMNTIQKILSIKPLKWLGKISAYTYAFHWPIILSVGCGVYLLLSNSLDYYYAVLIASIVVLIFSFTFSAVYIKFLSPLIQKIEDKIKELLVLLRKKRA